MCVHNRTFEGERVQKALHAVYQGVIIYAEFEKMLITGVLRCDAGITVNREHLCVTPRPARRAQGARLGVWSCIVGQVPQCMGLHPCSKGITSKLHVVYHIHSLTQAVLFQSSRVKRSLCLLTKLKVFSPRKTKGDFFFIKSGVCMWK